MYTLILRSFTISILLCLTLNASGQFIYKSDPFKTTPWTAVKWEENTPIVTIDDTWYELVALNNIPVDSLIKASQIMYSYRWRIEFALNISNILKSFGQDDIKEVTITILPTGLKQKNPPNNIELVHIKNNINNWFKTAYYVIIISRRIQREHTSPTNPSLNYITKRYFPPKQIDTTSTFGTGIGKFTFMIQDHTYAWQNNLPEYITKKKAEEDLDQLEYLLENEYAYLDLTSVDYKGALDMIRSQLGDGISRTDFAHQMQKVLGLFGDGHAKITFEECMVFLYDGTISLPFYVIDHNDRMVAVNFRQSKLFDKAHPYIRSINDIPADKWLAKALEMRPGGTVTQQRVKGVRWFNRFDYLIRCMHQKGDEFVIVLESEDRTLTKTHHLKLQRTPFTNGWSLPVNPNIPENIGYLRIYRMEDDKPFLESLVAQMQDFKETDGLIIDVRDNTGGRRDVVKKLFSFFMDSTDSPYIANVAALRLDEENDLHEPKGYLKRRSMHPLSSDKWSEEEKKAIESFAKSFQPEWKVADDKFSDYHYLMFSSKIHRSKYYLYNKPVVILMNGTCYSSTETFLGAFKNWRNVTIIGTPSSGGSGNPATHQLFNSLITLKLSTMASFQSNGKLYNGNGIIPDIILYPTLDDKLGQSDSMMEKALEILGVEE